MATFNPSIDLMSIPGAKIYSIPEGGRNVNYICIPADLNEISIEPSRSDATKQTAYMRTRMRPLSRAYIDSIIENKKRRGDEVNTANIESHEITINHTKEFIEAWVSPVSERVLKEHPEWASQNAREFIQGGNNDLYFEVRRRINKRIGKAYPVMFSDDNQTRPVQQFATPESFNTFSAGEQSQQQSSGTEAAPPFDDLPF